MRSEIERIRPKDHNWFAKLCEWGIQDEDWKAGITPVFPPVTQYNNVDCTGSKLAELKAIYAKEYGTHNLQSASIMKSHGTSSLASTAVAYMEEQNDFMKRQECNSNGKLSQDYETPKTNESNSQHIPPQS